MPKIKVKCSSCNGTGIYVGYAEKDGAAIVCHPCEGKGWIYYEYEEFKSREILPVIKRVYEKNCGFFIRNTKKIHEKIEDFGGMTYGEWLNGAPFPPKSEMRNRVCPSWWFRDEEILTRCCVIGSFLKCKHFHEKHKCWEDFDKKEAEDAK